VERRLVRRLVPVWAAIPSILALASFGLASLGYAAESYPSRPLRIVVPYGAGGSFDGLARILGQKLGEQMRQQFVVDNRAGATGRIGMEVGVKSAPDGYTLLIVGSAQTIAPSVYVSVPYDLRASLQPITMTATINNALLIHPGVPAQTVQEFISYAKAKPNAVRFGSGGGGGFTHLAAELFCSMADVRNDHLQIRGVEDERAAGQRNPDEYTKHVEYIAAGSGRQAARAGGDGPETLAVLAVGAHAGRIRLEGFRHGRVSLDRLPGGRAEGDSHAHAR
jgi:hypothetical protein